MGVASTLPELSEGTLHEVSERYNISVIKTIMPCVEGERSDCQPSTTTSVRLRAIELPRVDNLIYHPQHRT